jgi:hypothetical protein
MQAAAEQSASFSNGVEDASEQPEDAQQAREVMFRVLFHQLIEKDRQIAEKDKQIAQLLENQNQQRPEMIDIGWGAFNVNALEFIGIWAEENKPGDPVDPEKPRIRVFGESFTISQETLWYLYHELGLVTEEDRSTTQDKFAAITNEDSCLNRALLSEPLFILRAQDQFAAQLVRQWADLVENAEGGEGSEDKITGARAIADQMDAWGFHKVPD